MGLHFHQPARNVEPFLSALGQLDSYLARLEPGQQGRVARGDAQLAFGTRRNYQLRLAGKDFGFGADNIAVYGRGHGWMLAPEMFAVSLFVDPAGLRPPCRPSWRLSRWLPQWFRPCKRPVRADGRIHLRQCP